MANPATTAEGARAEALRMFDVLLAAKPNYIGGLSKSALGEWCENVVAAGYAIRAAGATERERAIEDALAATDALPEDAYDPASPKRVVYAEGWHERGDALRAALASAPVQTGTGDIDTERLWNAIETYLDNEDFGFVGSRIRAERIAEIYRNL